MVALLAQSESFSSFLPFNLRIGIFRHYGGAEVKLLLPFVLPVFFTDFLQKIELQYKHEKIKAITTNLKDLNGVNLGGTLILNAKSLGSFLQGLVTGSNQLQPAGTSICFLFRLPVGIS